MGNRATIMLGDVHGEFKRIIHQMKLKQITDCDIIQVGDFGLGFYKQHVEAKELYELNNYLKKSRCNLFVIRGNHDDPSRFKDLVELGSNIVLVPDYSSFELNGKRFLGVGGGVSIDRKERLATNDVWFQDEVIVENMDLIKSLGKDIDVLVTHSAPIRIVQDLTIKGITPLGIIEERMVKWDDLTLVADCTKEQHILQDVLDNLPNVKEVFFGHFHKSHTSFIGDIKYNLLDIHQMKECR